MVRNSYVQKSLQRMRERMELRGLKPITVAVYSRCVRCFITRVGKPLGSVTTKDIEQYLLGLARDGINPRTRNVVLVAIRFAFRTTVRRDRTTGIPLAKAPRRSPEILSGSEVGRLLDATTSLKYRAIFMLAYGAGLRISELVSLNTTIRAAGFLLTQDVCDELGLSPTHRQRLEAAGVFPAPERWGKPPRPGMRVFRPSVVPELKRRLRDARRTRRPL